MERRKMIRTIIQMTLSALVALFALLSAIGAFGWFATVHNTTGIGTNVQVQNVEELQIRAKPEGNDIGVSVIESTMGKLTVDYNDEESKKLYPGVAGSFSFYVHDGSDGQFDPYAFTYSVTIENNQFHVDDKYPEGFYKGADDKQKQQALDFINAHLMFFTTKDEKSGYSGWIKPGTTVLCEAKSTPCKVTVYWVWVGKYSEIFVENSGLLKEETRIQVASHFKDSEKMFPVDMMNSSEGYNVADTLIGVTLKYICFQIEVIKA